MSSAAATRAATAPSLTKSSSHGTLIPWQHIIEDPDQPRDHFDLAAQEALKGSIGTSSQKLAVIVRPIEGSTPIKYMVVDGARRYRSAKDLNIAVECIIRTDLEDPHARRRFQVLANWNRQGHTIHETVRFLTGMLEDPEVQAIERKEDKYFALGQLFGHTSAWVRKHLHLKRLHPDLYARLAPDTPKSERFPKSVAFSLSNVSHEKQLALAEKIDSGKLNAVRAKRLMANELLEGGQAAAGHKGRGPSDNMAIFQTFLKHLRLEGEMVQEMEEKTFTKMIAARPVSERRAIKKALGEAMTMLNDIKKRVEKVPDNQVSGK